MNQHGSHWPIKGDIWPELWKACQQAQYYATLDGDDGYGNDENSRASCTIKYSFVPEGIDTYMLINTGWYDSTGAGEHHLDHNIEIKEMMRVKTAELKDHGTNSFPAPLIPRTSGLGYDCPTCWHVDDQGYCSPMLLSGNYDDDAHWVSVFRWSQLNSGEGGDGDDQVYPGSP